MTLSLTRRTVTVAAALGCAGVLTPLSYLNACPQLAMSPEVRTALVNWHQVLAAYAKSYDRTFIDPVSGRRRGYSHIEEPPMIVFGRAFRQFKDATLRLVAVRAKSRADVMAKVAVLDRIYGPENVTGCHWMKVHIPQIVVDLTPQAHAFGLIVAPRWQASFDDFFEQDDEIMYASWHQFWRAEPAALDPVRCGLGA